MVQFAPVFRPSLVLLDSPIDSPRNLRLDSRFFSPVCRFLSLAVFFVEAEPFLSCRRGSTRSRSQCLFFCPSISPVLPIVTRALPSARSDEIFARLLEEPVFPLELVWNILDLHSPLTLGGMFILRMVALVRPHPFFPITLPCPESCVSHTSGVNQSSDHGLEAVCLLKPFRLRFVSVRLASSALYDLI